MDRLARELKNDSQSGQPIIYEHEFPTGKLRVNVIWDEWDRLTHEERTGVILRAYDVAESGSRERVALASGLTVPEAHAAGMLPYQIITALRSGDPVKHEDCQEAMIHEGGSILLDPKRPQFRFASEVEAEAAKRRLIQRLPGSEPVWLITREVGSVDEFYRR